MKKCIDCNTDINEVVTRSIRCPECKVLQRRITQQKNKQKNQYHKSPKAKYARYKLGALNRGLTFELTYEEFITHWDSNCVYCKDPIETVGLDRVDNTLGYTVDNIVDCCSTCNYMKHKMDSETFINKCKQIASVSLL